MLSLVAPVLTYHASFLAALLEYQAEHLADYDLLNYRLLTEPSRFAAYVDQLLAEARGQRLPEGYVPHSTFWLVTEAIYLGRVDIRHQLDDFLLTEGGHVGYNIRPSYRRQGFGSLALQLALPKVKELGLSKFLITCDQDNVGSRKIIEKNGGVLEDVRQLASGIWKRRYWITVE